MIAPRKPRSNAFDNVMFPLELAFLRSMRRRIIPHMSGRVLEIGVGTGVNLSLYNKTVQVTGLDNNLEYLGVAANRSSRAHLIQGDSAQLPFTDGSFDQAAGTLVMCSLPEPDLALRELKRVLVPGGWLILLEHVRGESGLMRSLTDRLAGRWYRFTQSCHIDRETENLVARSGFRIVTAPRAIMGLFQIIIARKG